MFIKKIFQYVRTYQVSLSWYYLVAIAVVTALIIIARRPDVVLYPQFWAEDGPEWFADAFQFGGLQALLIPHTGYFQTISRLVGALAQLFPLAFAPTVFNVVAILFKIAPVVFLFTKRWQKIIPWFWLNVCLSLVYLLLPSTAEIHANVTNIHWHSALLACLLLLSVSIEQKHWQWFDYLWLCLVGLSGPFALFLLPIAVIQLWVHRHKPTRNVFVGYLAILVITGTIQLFAIVHAGSARPLTELGATLPLFIELTAGQVFVSGLFGIWGYATLFNSVYWTGFTQTTVFLVGIVPVVYACFKASRPIKLFFLFALLVSVASFLKPLASFTEAQWPRMVFPGSVGRYWFYPMLLFLCSLLWCSISAQSKIVRIMSIVMLLCLPIGICADIDHPPWPDKQYKKQVETFEQLPSGTNFLFEIQPAGWKMKLQRP